MTHTPHQQRRHFSLPTPGPNTEFLQRLEQMHKDFSQLQPAAASDRLNFLDEKMLLKCGNCALLSGNNGTELAIQLYHEGDPLDFELDYAYELNLDSPNWKFFTDRMDKVAQAAEQFDSDSWEGFAPTGEIDPYRCMWMLAYDALSSGDPDKLSTFKNNVGIEAYDYTSREVAGLFKNVQELRQMTGMPITQFFQKFLDDAAVLTWAVDKTAREMNVPVLVLMRHSPRQERPIDASDLPETPPEPAIASAAHEEAALLQASEAHALLEWESIGQTDGIRTHRLRFYETAEHKQAHRGAMTYGTITKEVSSNRNWEVDGIGVTFVDLREAKKAAEALALQRLTEHGFIAKPQVEDSPSPGM